MEMDIECNWNFKRSVSNAHDDPVVIDIVATAVAVANPCAF